MKKLMLVLVFLCNSIVYNLNAENPEHVKKVWEYSRTKVDPDLRNLDVSFHDFTIDYPGEKLDLICADFTNTNFANADLTGANLTSATLHCTDFTSATLDEANLMNAKLQLADCTNADLNDTNLNGTVLTKTVFINADLTNATFINAELGFTNFTEADLTATDFTGSMRVCGVEVIGDFTNANLTEAKFFSAAELIGAELRGANFLDAKGEKTDFRGSSYKEAINIDWKKFPDCKK